MSKKKLYSYSIDFAMVKEKGARGKYTQLLVTNQKLKMSRKAKKISQFSLYIAVLCSTNRHQIYQEIK